MDYSEVFYPVFYYTHFSSYMLFHHVENTRSGHMVKKKNKASTFYGGWGQVSLPYCLGKAVT